MRRGLRSTAVAAAFGLLGFAGTALADPTSELASSAAQRCLFPAADDRVKPPYPQELYDAKIGASIAAEFEFSGPATAPSVRLEGQPRREFERVIMDYAEPLRVPCMGAADKPVKLRQTFDFVPNDGRKVAWSTPTDAANAAREALLKCVVRPDPEEIRYPGTLLSGWHEGTLKARVRYFSPDKPPTWEILFDGGARAFVYAVQPYLEMLRMPCVGAEAVEEDISIHFRYEPDGVLRQRVLKDLPLASFLSVVKPIKPGSVFFDTNTMQCPFDVRMTFKQPFEPNTLQELDEDVPSRHTFLDWLGQREINLDKQHSGQFLDQQMVVHIPCATIDL